MLEGKVPLRSGKPKAGGSTPGATNSLGKCLAPGLHEDCREFVRRMVGS